MLGSGRSGFQPENNKSIKGSDDFKLTLCSSGLPLVVRNRLSGLSGVSMLPTARDEWDKAIPPTSGACLLAEEEVEGVGGVI